MRDRVKRFEKGKCLLRLCAGCQQVRVAGMTERQQRASDAAKRLRLLAAGGGERASCWQKTAREREARELRGMADISIMLVKTGLMIERRHSRGAIEAEGALSRG